MNALIARDPEFVRTTFIEAGVVLPLHHLVTFNPVNLTPPERALLYTIFTEKIQQCMTLDLTLARGVEITFKDLSPVGELVVREYLKAYKLTLGLE